MLDFHQWASLTSEKIIVHICVYCDESGTHAPDKNGEPLPTVYGYIATANYWANEFYPEWQAVLCDFKVPYFHFCELNKSERAKPNRTYSHLSDSETDYFLDELSIVAGRVAIPCGSHGTLKGEKNPYQKIFELFFKDCFRSIDRHWPKFDERVAFFFESTGMKKWSDLILEAAENFEKKDKRLGTPAFPKWDDPQNGLPLQAADLLASSQRQNAKFFFENNRKVRHPRIIDVALLTNLYPKGDPHRYCNLTDERRARLIRAFRKDKDAKDIFRSIMGLPQEPYFPMDVLLDYKKRGAKFEI